jgi:hypothetical protein
MITIFIELTKQQGKKMTKEQKIIAFIKQWLDTNVNEKIEDSIEEDSVNLKEFIEHFEEGSLNIEDYIQEVA